MKTDCKWTLDSFDKEPDIARTNKKETGREDGKLQHKELEVLLQIVEEMELQHSSGVNKGVYCGYLPP